MLGDTLRVFSLCLQLGAGLTVQADGSVDGWLKTPRTLTEVVGASAPASSSLVSAWYQNNGGKHGQPPSICR